MSEASADDDDREDLALLHAWTQGSAAAGEQLLARHYDTVYSFFDRKVARDIGDLVQSTFETCLQAIDRFEGRSKFRTFLLGIARHKLLEHLRHRRREPSAPLDFSVTSLVDLGASPSEVLYEARRDRLIFEALRGIPLDDQLLLELYYWETLTAAELAQMLALSEPAVRSRLRRAKERLGERLAALERDPVLVRTTIHNLEDHIAQLKRQAAERYPEPRKE